ncbi:MAG: pantoate--beta-alanine ligase [Thermoleophilia bacterium]|nr:pantoate--beta-alanine ligase [Thermoleophilia bacterium]
MTTTPVTHVATVPELRAQLSAPRGEGRRIAFVPTMGALHAGHAELMHRARAVADIVVVSCFVNPTQFGPTEDLSRYPRTPEHDAELVAAAGVDVLWRPDERDVYGDDDAGTRLLAGPLGDILEGASRPGHFDGVVAVVARLLGAVQPDVLVLGEKDFQQLAILRRLVADLLLPVEVVGVPTIREADGLARSSRNAYLSPEDRAAAVAIPRALAAARARAADGSRELPDVLAAARSQLAAQPRVEVDYLVAAHATSLAPVTRVDDATVLLVAARVGSTRLIDNARLLPGPDNADHLPEVPHD